MSTPSPAWWATRRSVLRHRRRAGHHPRTADPVGAPSTLAAAPPRRGRGRAAHRGAPTPASAWRGRRSFHDYPGRRWGLQNDGGFNLLTAPNSVWAIGPSRRSACSTAAAAGRGRPRPRQLDQAAADYRATVLRAFQQVEDQLALSNRLADAAREEALAVEAAKRTEALA